MARLLDHAGVSVRLVGWLSFTGGAVEQAVLSGAQQGAFTTTVLVAEGGGHPTGVPAQRRRPERRDVRRTRAEDEYRVGTT